MIPWQIEFGIIQGSTGVCWRAIAGTAIGDVDECVHVVCWERLLLGAENAPATVDAKGRTETKHGDPARVNAESEGHRGKKHRD